MTYYAPEDSASFWPELEHQAAHPEPSDYDPADALTAEEIASWPREVVSPWA